ncbi:hypothetical protein E1A91_A02G099600v1 [Gossypium mustelinum]|uniref:FYVE-type domain-containing protein n=1 Tax=Gossypium mustelinum TaxID=34275 RepID=A0A5D3A5J0_GOSMU|nr:protein FREE1-like [Gossypium arboreum]TYJ46128.1 hypothetical protein E1A91_A02G099600v1 [Gossypium mustelinum]
MQQGDLSSSYYQPSNPNTSNPSQFHHSPYASAPPFSPSDYQNPDPSYAPPPPPTLYSQPSFNQHPIAPTSAPAAPSFPPYDSPVSRPPYYQPYDQYPSYVPPPPDSNPNPIPPDYSTPYNQIGSSQSSVPPAYDNPYDNSMKLDQSSGSYFDDKFGARYNQSRYDMGPDLYGKRYDSYPPFGDDGGYGDGVYAYEGGKVEPYGARGTAPKSSTWVQFDDYGRTINFPSGKDSSGSSSGKIVRAVPKAETLEAVKSGVQKFRVKLLSEGGGEGPMDVLCQIGLDGIRMLDPSTSRTLRIYPIENITRCEVTDTSTFAFWSKSSVDIEPRWIGLQSNSYTTNTLLDIVTAATVQVKEMGGRSRPSDSLKTTEQPSEKKKGFGDWMNLMKPGTEEKDHWVPDEAVSKCTACGTDFGAFVRKHHCRNCGDIFCDKCTQGRIALTADENAQPVRVCDRCMAEVTQRLSIAKETASKPAALQSHEDLARKLEEMEKNCRASSGSKSDGSGRRMKEVACPICTVHLQVQVPSSGSETIECGVCQHPFLVSAH